MRDYADEQPRHHRVDRRVGDAIAGKAVAMPITPTKKIWMDGELVDWDEAKIARAHATPCTTAPASSRASAPTRPPRASPCSACASTSERLLASAKIFMIDVPFTRRRAGRGDQAAVVRENELHDGCYMRPLVYLGYGEMGLNPLPCPVNVSIAAWPWGAYLGDEGMANGVRMKISSWQRHDPNAVPDGGQGHRDVRELVAGQGRGAQGRLRRGDHAGPRRPGLGVHRREPLHRPRRRAHHARRPPRPARSRASPRTRSIEIANDLGYEVRHEALIRTDLYLADEAFLTGHGGRGRADRARSTTARSATGRPGPITKEIQETYLATVRGEVPSTRSGWTMSEQTRARARPRRRSGHRHSARSSHSHSHSMASHHFELPDLPETVDIFDTILRDGSQQEGLSLTVEDKIRVAEQLDHLGVAYIEGGWPGANPNDTEFFRRFKQELTLDDGDAGGLRLDPAGRDRRPRTTRCSGHLVEADTEVVCIVAKSWDRHVDEALRHLARRGAWPWSKTRSRS